MKKILSIIVIFGFAGGSLIGIFVMNHSDFLKGRCSTSPLHTSACPAGSLPMVAHSISMYQAFTNGLVSSVVMQILMIALLFVTVEYVLRRDIISIPHLFTVSRNLDANLRRPQVVTHWLSLLINSPSLI